MRILILGDGDFSFTRAFLENLISASVEFPSFELIATSFDSEITLKSKYSGFAAIKTSIQKLAKQNAASVEIKHCIDATKPLNEQLYPLSCADHATDYFDCIIFNFPHLGIESAVAHASLLAHIFHAVAGVMRPMNELSLLSRTNVDSLSTPNSVIEPSCFTLALTETQFHLWRTIDMANRNHFSLASQSLLVPSVYSGYEMKRHHVGKSFRRRVEHSECKHYSFQLIGFVPTTALATAVSTTAPTTAVSTTGPTTVTGASLCSIFSSFDICNRMKVRYFATKQQEEQRQQHQALFHKAASGDEVTSLKRSCAATSPNSSPSGGSPERRPETDDCMSTSRPPRRKVHKIETMTKELIRELVETTTTANEGVSEEIVTWECRVCLRKFNSVQGVRTHAYVSHVLTNNESITMAGVHPNPTAVQTLSDHSVQMLSETVIAKLDPVAGLPECQSAPLVVCLDTSLPLLTEPTLTSASSSSAYVDIAGTFECPTLTSASSSSAYVEIVGTFECPICGHYFMSQEALTAHVDDGVTPIDESASAQHSQTLFQQPLSQQPPAQACGGQQQCIKCFKMFRNVRAVTQHSLTCKATG